MSKERITIVLADDHHLVRQALRVLLESDAQFLVVGETADGLKVASLVARVQPDVLIIDLMLPGVGGMEVTRQVRRRTPETRVIILSIHMNEAHVLEALRSGAMGYLRKDATAADLMRAIRQVVEGHMYLSAPFSDKAIEAYQQKAAEASGDPYETLTPREREVFHLAAEGLGNVEMARRLGISPRTIETHRARVMRKLSLRRKSDVVREALRRGVISLEQESFPET